MTPTPMTRARASALLCAAAALGAAPARGLAQANAMIRLAVLPIENSAEAYYSNDMGFFAKAGIEVEIQQMRNTPEIGAAIASNAIDIGISDIYTLATIHSKNIPLVVIAPGAEYLSPTTTRISAIVLPANSTVRKAKDLNGKIIATTALHSLSETAPRVWIDQNGGDSSTVKFVELPYPAMPAALDAGRIDAAWVTEPFIGVATKSGRVLAYGFEGISKHFLFNAWFTTPQWAKAHPDLVSRFAAVMAETAAWANQNPAKSGEILAKYVKIDPAIIVTLTRAHFAERLTPALMQPLIDVSAKYNNFSSFPARDLMYGPSR
jgi:NitT/TauT family transport system substrate-binding protein